MSVDGVAPFPNPGLPTRPYRRQPLPELPCRIGTGCPAERLTGPMAVPFRYRRGVVRKAPGGGAMRKWYLVWLFSTLVGACGGNQEPAGCSLTLAIDGRAPVTKACIAGAGAGLTGPAAAQDNQVSIAQERIDGDFVVIRLNLSLDSPPTARVYDEGTVRSYLGTIEDTSGHGWRLQPKFAPGSFQVEVKSMEELGPEDDLKGGALMGYRIHGTAKATLTAPQGASEPGTATLTATF
jgi:hypothetical protein